MPSIRAIESGAFFVLAVSNNHVTAFPYGHFIEILIGFVSNAVARDFVPRVFEFSRLLSEPLCRFGRREYRQRSAHGFQVAVQLPQDPPLLVQIVVKSDLEIHGQQKRHNIIGVTHNSLEYIK